MKKLLYLIVVGLLVLPIMVIANVNLGIKKADESIVIPLLTLDSAGVDAAPDSVQILTWLDGGTGLQFSTNNTTYPFAAIGIDTSKIFADTTYWFVDQIQDIDGSPTPTQYSLAIDVITWTKAIATHNRATVQVIVDTLQNYLDSTALATAAAGADANWDELVSGHAVALSFGDSLIQAISGQGVIVTTNNDKTGYTLTTADINTIAGESADSVWEELVADHTVSLTFGDTLTQPIVNDSVKVDGSSLAATADAITATTLAATAANEIADTTWTADTTGNKTAGGFGRILGAINDTIENLATLSDVADSSYGRKIVKRGIVKTLPDVSGFSSTVFTEADDYWIDNLIEMRDGTAVGQITRISDFTAATDSATFSPSFSVEPAIGDSFYVLAAFSESPSAGSGLDTLSTVFVDRLTGRVADTTWLSSLEARDGTAGSFGDSAQGWGATSAGGTDTLNIKTMMERNFTSASGGDGWANMLADSTWLLDTTGNRIATGFGNILAAINDSLEITAMDNLKEAFDGDAVGSKMQLTNLHIETAVANDTAMIISATGTGASPGLLVNSDNIQGVIFNSGAAQGFLAQGVTIGAEFNASAGDGFVATGTGAGGEGIVATGGSGGAGGAGMRLSGQGATGDGLALTSVSGDLIQSEASDEIGLATWNTSALTAFTGGAMGDSAIGGINTWGQGGGGSGLDTLQTVFVDRLTTRISDSVWLSLLEARDGTAGSFGDSAQGWGATAAGGTDTLNIKTMMERNFTSASGGDGWANMLADSTWLLDTTGNKIATGFGNILGKINDTAEAQDGWVAREASLYDPATDSVIVDGSSLAATADAITATTLSHTAALEISDTTWDEVLTGGTHNVTNSSGKRLRELSDAQVIHSGTSDNVPANTASTISLQTGGGDPTVSSVDDFYNHQTIILTGGTGIGQVRTIPDYTGSNQSATIAPDWDITPDATSEYEVIPGIVHAQTAAGGYEGGAVWISSTGSTTALIGVDGTIDNPIDDGSIANARTVANALNLQAFELLPGASVTLDQAYDNWEFRGKGYTIALGGQSVAGTHIDNGFITGIGTGASRVVFRQCVIANIDVNQFAMLECGLLGTIKMTDAANYTMDGCFASQPGDVITLSFSTTLSTNLIIQHWSGSIMIDSMGEAGTDSITIAGVGNVTFTVSNVAGVAVVQGISNITDNSVTLTSLTETIALIKGDSAEYMNVKSMAGASNTEAPTNINDWYQVWTQFTTTGVQTTAFVLADGGQAHFKNQVMTFSAGNFPQSRRLSHIGIDAGGPDTFFVEPLFSSAPSASETFYVTSEFAASPWYDVDTLLSIDTSDVGVWMVNNLAVAGALSAADIVAIADTVFSRDSSDINAGGATSFGTLMAKEAYMSGTGGVSAADIVAIADTIYHRDSSDANDGAATSMGVLFAKEAYMSGSGGVSAADIVAIADTIFHRDSSDVNDGDATSFGTRLMDVTYVQGSGSGLDTLSTVFVDRLTGRVADTTWESSHTARDDVAGSFGDSSQTWGTQVDLTSIPGADVSMTYRAIDTATGNPVQGVSMSAFNKSDVRVAFAPTTPASGEIVFGFKLDDTVYFNSTGPIDFVWTQRDTIFGVTNGLIDTTEGFQFSGDAPASGKTAAVTVFITNNDRTPAVNVAVHAYLSRGKVVDSAGFPVYNQTQTLSTDSDGKVTFTCIWSSYMIPATQWYFSTSVPGTIKKKITIPRETTITLDLR